MANNTALKPISVSQYLDCINEALGGLRARIKGEISRVSFQKHTYFAIKDPKDESVLDCIMWVGPYRLCGLDFAPGMEVILEGRPSIYKPSGRFSFIAETAEPAGEGALKKAYDQLKQKLEKEGLFAPEIKKPLPDLPQNIGLITSKTGAVISDFTTNIGKYGYKIKFCDTRVEGQKAVADLLKAIDIMSTQAIDVLVITRGGGSFESFQAFNNEHVVRAIARCEIPVICGLGHEKDIPLTALAADLAVSTATAAASVLNQSWQNAQSALSSRETVLTSSFATLLSTCQRKLDNSTFNVTGGSTALIRKYHNTIGTSLQKFSLLAGLIERANMQVENLFSSLMQNYQRDLELISPEPLAGEIPRKLRNILQIQKNNLLQQEKLLLSQDPKRLLKLGYSIAKSKGTIIRSRKQVSIGDFIDIGVSDGTIRSKAI